MRFSYFFCVKLLCYTALIKPNALIEFSTMWSGSKMASIGGHVEGKSVEDELVASKNVSYLCNYVSRM